MSGGNEHPWLAAVREEARHLVIRRVLKLAAASMTVTSIFIVLASSAAPVPKRGCGLRGSFSAPPFAGYGQAGSGTGINIQETN